MRQPYKRSGIQPPYDSPGTTQGEADYGLIDDNGRPGVINGQGRSGMRRSWLAATVSVSLLLGGGTGVALHERWSDPLHRSSLRPPQSWSKVSATPTESRMATPSTAAPSTSASSAPSAATPTRPDEPAFTRLALLTPEEFLQRGWGAARLVDRFDHIPAPAITPCVTVPPGTPGLRAGYAATYASDRTEAAEVVARFDTAKQAADELGVLRATVAGCANASAAPDRLRTVAAHHPTPAGTSELRWWNTRPMDGGPARGVVGLVQVDDRVALLNLRSDVSDPAKTTKIESLLIQAGRRLV